MKTFITGWMVLILLAGCADKRPTVDYDPGYSSAQLHTFTIADETDDGIAPITSQRIANALRQTLVAKGYRERQTDADFIAQYHVKILKDVPSNVSIGFGFGTAGPHTGMSVGASKQLRHDEAMLEIRMLEPKDGHVFWTVSYRTRIDSSASPQERTSRINAVVSGMLESFPKAQQ